MPASSGCRPEWERATVSPTARYAPPTPRSSLHGRVRLNQKQIAKITEQFGTLGSGNHFMEICLDERDRVWVVLHSGSRGIGNELATKHIEGAKDPMRTMSIALEDPDLAYLLEGTPGFDAYIADMLWAQEYAHANREEMMDAVLRSFGASSLRERPSLETASATRYTESTATTTTRAEHHDGHDVWITEKAPSGPAHRPRRHPGLDGNLVVHRPGKGSEASYESSSHGAGRRLGRKAAFRQLTTESLRTAMAGRAWDDTMADQLVDEHPGCVQADRPGHGRPGRSGRGRPRAAPGCESQGDLRVPIETRTLNEGGRR